MSKTLNILALRVKNGKIALSMKEEDKELNEQESEPTESITEPTSKKIDVQEDTDELDTKEEITEVEEDSYIDELTDESNIDENTEDSEDKAETIKESDNEDSQEENLNSEKTEDEAKSVDITETKTVGDAIEKSKNEPESFKSDADVDAAVDDIVRSESDEAIAEADAKVAALQEKKSKVSFGQKIKNVFAAWWNNKPVRYGTFAALILLFTAIVLLPTTRYTVLNAIGIRVNSSMIVVDSQTRLPLKDINVQLQDKFGKTNEEGEISFNDLKLGESILIISKLGYADTNEQIVLGWGSNPIGEQPLVATGEQYTFVLSDWKSGAVISDAEATSGENSARADDTGKIVLTIGEKNISNIEVKITANNYRGEVFTSEQLNNKNINVKMVPSKNHIFVSTRDGKYDLYKIDVDGLNEKILLTATGKEREVPIVVPHPTKNIVAFTSSREGDVNSDGFTLDGLFIIDSSTAEQERIARSEQLQVIGWSGDNLVFLQVVEGTSAGNDQRSKLVSYNYTTGERKDLASSNYFNDVELVGNKLYYAVSSFAVPESQAKLYSVDVDGQNNGKLVDYQVWNIFRTKYDTLLFSAVDQKWFQQVGDSPIEEIAKQNAPLSQHFVESPDGKRTVWVEIRDGKGVLLKSSTEEIKEEQVISAPGLYDVLYWVNDSTVVLRFISTSETADYVLNLDGGNIQKITDVTATRNTYF